MPSYMSQSKLDDLRAELEKRKKITRREIADQISTAKDLGDLSENFEYQDAKEQQGLNEARIIQIGNMITDAVVVEESLGGDEINIGTTFVAKCNGSEKTFTIVGSTEADPMSGKISNESPIGQAFLGRKPGEGVEIEVPSGVMSYTIITIK